MLLLLLGPSSASSATHAPETIGSSHGVWHSETINGQLADGGAVSRVHEGIEPSLSKVYADFWRAIKMLSLQPST